MSLREIQSILNAPEIGPEELIKCALGIKTTEIRAYCVLVNQGPSPYRTPRSASRTPSGRPLTGGTRGCWGSLGLPTKIVEIGCRA